MPSAPPSSVLYRDIHHDFPRLTGGKGSYLTLGEGDDARVVLDASGGASVACVGHGNERVQAAMVSQLKQISYCCSVLYTTDVCEKLARELVKTTHGHMSRAYIVNSGSEAMEAAMKLSRQFFLEKSSPEPQRTRFISRDQSYHGTTLGSLSMGGHAERRAKFEPMLLQNISKVSPCFSYRDRGRDESNDEYVARLANELDAEFQRVGPETVCAFVAEPVVGAALGCVPALPFYFKAMRAVCDKYGALLVLDEVMCGMGRTGTMHAWEQEGVVPDIQTLGKGLGGGYQPIAGVLVNRGVVDVLSKGTGAFAHGHTYQSHPIACAASLEILNIIQEENLIYECRRKGAVLLARLSELLSRHPNVGDIRGRGLFWGIEFVADKTTKTAFPASANVAMEIAELGLTEKYAVAVYPSCGAIIISPPYNVADEDVEVIACRVHRLVADYFYCKIAVGREIGGGRWIDTCSLI